MQLGSINTGPVLSTVVAPGQVSVTASIIEPHGPFDTDNPALFTLWIKDEFGNNQTQGGHNIQVEVLPLQASLSVAAQSVADMLDGTYSIMATATVSGAYVISLRGFKDDDTSEGFTLPFIVGPGAISHVQSQVLGPGILGAVAGSDASFSISFRDSSGNSAVLEDERKLQISFQPADNNVMKRISLGQDPSVRVISYLSLIHI